MGLVDRVVDPDRLMGETLEYARDLAVNCSPASMATMKRQVYDDLGFEAWGAYEAVNSLNADLTNAKGATDARPQDWNA